MISCSVTRWSRSSTVSCQTTSKRLSPSSLMSSTIMKDGTSTGTVCHSHRVFPLVSSSTRPVAVKEPTWWLMHGRNTERALSGLKSRLTHLSSVSVCCHWCCTRTWSRKSNYCDPSRWWKTAQASTFFSCKAVVSKRWLCSALYPCGASFRANEWMSYLWLDCKFYLKSPSTDNTSNSWKTLSPAPSTRWAWRILTRFGLTKIFSITLNKLSRLWR